MTARVIPEELVGHFFAVGSVGEANPEIAVEYIANLPLPYWFQVPAIYEEDMIRQFGYAIEGFEEKSPFVVDVNPYTFYRMIDDEKPIIIDENHAHGLYLILRDRQFKFFKTQQTAPATMCFSTRDSKGRQLISKQMFRFYCALMQKFAKGQMELLKPSCEKIIFCQDDPALGFVIEMIQREDVAGLNPKRIITDTERIFPGGTIPAYHYCEDWRTLEQEGCHLLWGVMPKIVHIDILAYPPKIDEEQAELINQFLEKGGGIALGALPNIDFNFKKPVLETLRHNLRTTLVDFMRSGVNIDLLKENTMISTQCGLSRASDTLTKEIHLASPKFPEIMRQVTKTLEK